MSQPCGIADCYVRLCTGKFFHSLSVALAHGIANQSAELINALIGNAVENEETFPALLYYALFGKQGQMLADVGLTHAAQFAELLHRELLLKEQL